MAGGLGAAVSLDQVPRDADADDAFVLLFSESPTRFVLEVAPEDCQRVEDALRSCPLGRVGEVARPIAATDAPCRRRLDRSVDASLEELKEAWQRPLRWS